MTRFIKIFLFILVAVMVTGCSNSKTENLPKDAISYCLSAEPASLDPTVTYGIEESIVQLALFEGLTRMDSDNRPQPALAKGWDISQDGMVYTFHLRDGICWDDGTPITAQDFEYSWLRAIDPELASANAYMLFNIKGAEDYNSEKASRESVAIKAIDDKTLQVELTAPAPYFIDLMAFHVFYPVPKHKVTAKSTPWGSDGEDIVGCGPFKLYRWSHSNEIVLIKNEKYWNASDVKPQCLRMPISASASTRLNLLECNMIDLMLQPPSADEKRLADSGLLQVYPQLGTAYYVFNVQKAPFNNKDVRKAFALAIERQQLISNVFHGNKAAAYAFVPPGINIDAVDFRNEAGDLIKEDVAEAQRLLASTGMANAPVTILYNNGDTQRMIAEAIQRMWKDNLGIDAELAVQETKVFYDTREHGDYQVACANWVADFADPINFLQVFSDEVNDAQYHNPVYDQLIKDILKESNPVKRKDKLHQAEKMLFDDCVFIPIYYTSQLAVANPKLKGIGILPMGPIDFIHAYRED